MKGSEVSLRTVRTTLLSFVIAYLLQILLLVGDAASGTPRFFGHAETISLVIGILLFPILFLIPLPLEMSLKWAAYRATFVGLLAGFLFYTLSIPAEAVEPSIPAAFLLGAACGAGIFLVSVDASTLARLRPPRSPHPPGEAEP